MDFQTLANALVNIQENVYLNCQPEILDFTDASAINSLHIHTQDQVSELQLKVKDLGVLIKILENSVFKEKQRIVFWNYKNFASFVKFHTKKDLKLQGSLLDLKILEGYAGFKYKAPRTLPEAMLRIKGLVEGGNWKTSQNVYRSVYSDLIKTTIPSIETTGVLDLKIGKVVYPYYEVDGEVNGRLSSHRAYKYSFLPHGLTEKDKSNLNATNNQLFMCFDFKNMEVGILGNLSKDEQLEKMLNLEKDFYVNLYETVTGNKYKNKNDRMLAKKILLPVIYGQSAFSMREVLGLDLNIAESIISRVKELFPIAFEWIETFQKSVKNGFYQDHFGRKRYIEKEYLARNFAIQSPASLVCLDKLNKLYFELKDITKIAYNVRDGYVLYANKENWKTVFKTAHNVLTEESQILSGLKLRVSCFAGKDLNNLKKLELNVEKRDQ